MNEQATLLVVDDTPENIDVLKGLLSGDYKIKAAINGERALKIASSDQPPDLILLDIMMPGMDGYEVCRRLKAEPKTAPIPVIFLTAKAETADEEAGLKLGAVDYITKPISPPIVKARVATQLALFNQSRALEAKVQERTAMLEKTRLQVIQRLGRAAEFKDNETGLHVIRMSHYSALLAEAAGWAAAEVQLLLSAAPMHDIGKIGIPDAVLTKPAKLDDQEWQTMRKHPDIGAEILGEEGTALMDLARQVALTHHEKWDGSGYPKGLAKDAIPQAGRIVAIADVFDALTCVRPYKKAWSTEDAVQLIQDEAGKHFDPQLVPLFVSILPQIEAVRKQYAEGQAS
ncbi:MAG: response regulator [bacterium]|nr:response regulator [bacterium]